jgi:hypothetical protein
MKNFRNSPFFSRSYGGFSKEQIEFIRSHLVNIKARYVLDPFAGQGTFLAELAYEGRNVYLTEINPALTILSKLRSPDIVLKHDYLIKWFLKTIQPFKGKRTYKNFMKYSDDWVEADVKKDLMNFHNLFHFSSKESPFIPDSIFWENNSKKLFALGILLLASRKLVCCRESDNRTWFIKGGILKERKLYNVLTDALFKWSEYISSQKVFSSSNEVGSIKCISHNAVNKFHKITPKPNLIITSPPYANRLDYSRLWAPEIELLAAMFPKVENNLKSIQIGSTVIKDKKSVMNKDTCLPLKIRQALNDIRNDNVSKASSNYYYPFFHNYAIMLYNSLSNIIFHLKKDGFLIIILRDTMRKGIIFPTVELVRDFLGVKNGLKVVEEKTLTIHNHVGLLQKSNGTSNENVLQREWWIVYQKVSK